MFFAHISGLNFGEYYNLADEPFFFPYREKVVSLQTRTYFILIDMDNSNEPQLTLNVSDTQSDERAKYEVIAKKSGMLAAVKAYKDDHNCDLKEAKYKIDSWEIKSGDLAANGKGCVALFIAIASTFAGMMVSLFVFII